MPRQGRLDAPGTLHHVMSRGQERSTIFRDAIDYRAFLDRLGKQLTASQTACLAWCLMPNHLHLVLITGRVPLSTLMRRILISYAIHFNRRWRRSGYVFQGRYKSLLCEREAYLLALVRYVHLNPVRAGLCKGLAGLAHFPWSGHRRLLGSVHPTWQDSVTVLEQFAPDIQTAKKEYVRFCAEGLAEPPDPRLAGEGLRHLVEGGWEAMAGWKRHSTEVATERLLGSTQFAETMLRSVEERERWRSRAKREGLDLERLMRLAAKRFGYSWNEWRAHSGTHPRAEARAIACYWAVDRLGCSEVEVARFLGLSQGAVSKAVARGEAAAERRRLSFSLETLQGKKA